MRPFYTGIGEFIPKNYTVEEMISEMSREQVRDLINIAIGQLEFKELGLFPDHMNRPKVVKISWLIEPYEEHNSLKETSDNIIALAKEGKIYSFYGEDDNLYFADHPIPKEVLKEALYYFETIDLDRPGCFYVTNDDKYKIVIDY